MKLWACFVCGSLEVCPHQEPELAAWAYQIGLERALEAINRAAVDAQIEREKERMYAWRKPSANAA
jgi:hypothetical protein